MRLLDCFYFINFGFDCLIFNVMWLLDCFDFDIGLLDWFDFINFDFDCLIFIFKFIFIEVWENLFIDLNKVFDWFIIFNEICYCYSYWVWYCSSFFIYMK